MSKGTLFILAISIVFSTSAQTKKPVKKAVRNNKVYGVVAAPEPEIFIYVEQQADFYGGSAALDNYLDKSLYYPDLAIENGIGGIVYLRFMVDESGAITGVQLMKGIGYGCDQEAMRVVKAMPAWRPAKINGKPTKSVCVLPVGFTLK